MAFTIAVLATTAGIGFGASEIIHANSSGDKKQSAPNMPALPNPDDATKRAEDEQRQNRRLLLTTGGQTDYTGGTANVKSSDVLSRSLLGGDATIGG